MKDDGKCLECQLELAKKEIEKLQAEVLKHAANAASWEERARRAENKLKNLTKD